MWKATFKDGHTLVEMHQVNGRDVVHSFSEVLKNLDMLESLSVVQGTRMFTVNMLDGKFTVDVSGISHDFYATNFATTFSGELINIRPIYFVRETVEFSEGIKHMAQSSLAVINFVALGFQANLNGGNVKKYLAILPDGTYTIEDK